MIFSNFDGYFDALENLENLEETVENMNYETAAPRKIKCFNKINVTGNRFAEKNHEEIDKLDFEKMNNHGKSFVEFLIKEEYVHLYFDIDDVKTLEEYLCFNSWLLKISEIFGKFSIGGYTNNKEFSIGGYTNNKEFAEYGYRFWQESEKTLSLHVVFYESCISSADLTDIMKMKNGKFINYEINPLCDGNVYKLNSRQAFRHVLSDKIYNRKDDEKYKENHGYILDGEKPFNTNHHSTWRRKNYSKRTMDKSFSTIAERTKC